MGILDKTYNKLVRNDIPDLIARQGNRVTYEIIKNDDNRFKKCLVDKLYEETDEILGGINRDSKEEVLEEAADIYTVLLEICYLYGISVDELEGKYHEKLCKAGGFSKGVYLVKTEYAE